ncbi:hypothetical protein Tco_0990367 [Tanacetum coccineum]|uniref:Uncharacterized protein n=1 Tax=Tanacetum coccineum TaxID=301880 RepID=A0ABQ5EWW9_9ASTR
MYNKPYVARATRSSHVAPPLRRHKPFTAQPSRGLYHEVTTFIKVPVDTSVDCDGEVVDILYRFGFDPKTDDYKVVKLTCVLGAPKNSSAIMQLLFSGVLNVVKEWLQVEVFSMRNSSWELITQRFPSHISKICYQDEVYGDGHNSNVHWICYTGEERDRQTVVAFDLSFKTFNEMSLPDSLLVGYQNVLGFLAGKLCAMSCTNVAVKAKSSKIEVRLSSITKIVQYVDSVVWIGPAQYCFVN